MRRILSIIAATVFLFALIGCQKESFELQSQAFSNYERIADKYCHGTVAGRENISLPFNWINPPDNTQSFALIMHDSDGSDWIHWAVFNIPAYCNEIAENASGNNMPEGSVELNNQFRTKGYGGPEPSRESGTHWYIITLYALNTAVINDLSGFKNLKEINVILEGKIIGEAEITGTYSRE